MKRFTLICCTAVVLASCGGNNATAEEDYTTHKESLQETETKHPLRFLKVTGDDKKNLVGQTVIRGTITNTATIVPYRDVRVKMLCYKDGRQVEEHEDVIPDIIAPGQSQSFKTRYRLPRGTDSIALSVMSAAVAKEPTGKQ